MLKHEQGHFDIGLLCAKEMENAVKQTLFLKDEFPEKYNEIRKNILTRFRAMDKQYDDETKHSKNKANQEKWNSLLNEKLN